MSTEITKCWGLKVCGPRPYIGYHVHFAKSSVPITQKYHKSVRVVVMTHREYCRLKRKAGEKQ